MDAGSAIRRARLRAGLTQHALANRAGTSQATLSAYESGRKQPSLRTLDRLLTAAGTRLTVVPTAAPREPGPDELARRGRDFARALELAEALPVRRRTKLRYPRLPQATGR